MRSSEDGFTLVEMVVTVAILGAAVVLTRLGINFLNIVARQNSRMESQRQAQTIIFNIAREIRNSKDIVDVNYDHIVLSAFNLKAHNYDSPQLFDPVNAGTITYQVRNNAGGVYLERKAEFPTDGGGVPNIQKLLRERILTPDATNYMFRGGPGVIPPYDSVDLRLRMKPAFADDGPVSYDETVVKRAARH